jgi:hypothetical protein
VFASAESASRAPDSRRGLRAPAPKRLSVTCPLRLVRSAASTPVTQRYRAMLAWGCDEHGFAQPPNWAGCEHCSGALLTLNARGRGMPPPPFAAAARIVDDNARYGKRSRHAALDEEAVAAQGTACILKEAGSADADPPTPRGCQRIGGVTDAVPSRLDRRQAAHQFGECAHAFSNRVPTSFTPGNLKSAVISWFAFLSGPRASDALLRESRLAAHGQAPDL